MGHLSKLVTPAKMAVAGLAAALALPFVQSAGAAQGAISRITTVPGYSLSVVHEFPVALVQTPKFLALSRDGNIYGATSAVGSSNGTVFRLSGSAYTAGVSAVGSQDRMVIGA